ncbi:MAG TPA: ABC transporter substrate-binding protein [Solirubrobacterales bacterium]|jgi:peptide/nickel transport system substrate-binding protein|nr:ABC transporter substrate-binding protein [Solirubrobacterales bacterium]
MVAFVCVPLVAGCGGDNERGGGEAGLPPAGGGGVLAYALPALPANLDPLAADSRFEQVVARQLYEPLVSSLDGPYGGPTGMPGLATSAAPSSGRTVWTLVLRDGVLFRDGSPFNASAVLANSRRWLTSAMGRALLPGLFAVDAPRPNEVRFIFRERAAGVPELLASPRLGIVSPQALAPATGERSSFDPEAIGSGTGAFELGGQSPDRLDLARNAGWWGSALGLGPALDGISFIVAPSGAGRLGLLQGGDAQVAEPLGPAELGAIASEPLLRSSQAGGVGIGYEASVRGLDPVAVRLLSSVWLTTIDR